MRPLTIVALLILWQLCPASQLRAEEPSAPPVAGDQLNFGPTFSCASENNLYKSLVAGGADVARHESAEAAIEHARPDSAVLILADGYPATPVRVSQALLDAAGGKRLRLYVEYPESFPGLKFGPSRRVHWERAVVASNSIDLGLPVMRILTLHDCTFRTTSAARPSLVAARVAGFDTAVYGLPRETFPILFKTSDGVLIATTKLSCFNTARYSPVADWPVIWQHILADLDPAGAPHKLIVEPTVRPTYEKSEPLPPDAEALALGRAAEWIRESRLLISAARERDIHDRLRRGREETNVPGPDDPPGDGSLGILEGYASRISPDGNQSQRLPIRADCQAESAAVLAMHAALAEDEQSREVARNLLNFLYVKSELHGGVRADSRHPAFGLIGWGAIAPAWQIAYYGDDNARTLLATMAAAASLKSNEWDAAMLTALYANLRTTGRLGFRGDRIDLPQLEQFGWQHFHDADTVNFSPHFEAYLWACYLWAYARTGDSDFLDRTKIAIGKTMDAYPDQWRLGDNLERAHMLLALAWLVRIEDTPRHRAWLAKTVDDILDDQVTCGAISERLGGAGAGHYVVPITNEAYGTSETPLAQQNGDPVSDQLYTTGFVLLGLHEAAAATGDEKFKLAEDKLANYLVRIQVQSEAFPYLDGAWFRAFDYERWDYWASSADMGWGAWCVESGWGPAWNAITFGLRAKRTSLWELTASSRVADHLGEVKQRMSENDGQPWRGAP